MTDHDDDEATAVSEPKTVEVATEEAKKEPETVESDAEEIDESDAVDVAGKDEPAKDEALEEEALEEEAESVDLESPSKKPPFEWSRIFAYIVLPVLVLVVALAAACPKYVDTSVRDADAAGAQAVRAAKDTTVAILSYKPDTVEKQLTDARGLLTGDFLESYTELTTKLVIPGAKQQQISATANVPQAALVSADREHAVTLVFVNQTVTIGASPPSETASAVRVTLDKVNGKWLIAKFDPV